MNWTAGIISFGAVFATTSVLLVFQLGQPRIFFSMARDGLLPAWAARVHRTYRTPHVTTILTGVAVGVVAGITIIDEMVEMCNIGTLFAFVLVAAGVMIIRLKEPHQTLSFRTPFFPWVPIGAILSCTFLMLKLPWVTWRRFALWLGLGMVIYFLHSRRKSRLALSTTKPAVYVFHGGPGSHFDSSTPTSVCLDCPTPACVGNPPSADAAIVGADYDLASATSMRSASRSRPETSTETRSSRTSRSRASRTTGCTSCASEARPRRAWIRPPCGACLGRNGDRPVHGSSLRCRAEAPRDGAGSGRLCLFLLDVPPRASAEQRHDRHRRAADLLRERQAAVRRDAALRPRGSRAAPDPT